MWRIAYLVYMTYTCRCFMERVIKRLRGFDRRLSKYQTITAYSVGTRFRVWYQRTGRAYVTQIKSTYSQINTNVEGLQLLAPSQVVFQESGNIVQWATDLSGDGIESTYTMTNAGLSIQLPALLSSTYQLAIVRAVNSGSRRCLAVPIKTLPRGNLGGVHFGRFPFPSPSITDTTNIISL